MALIALDVDNVLLDVHTPWRERYNRASGGNLRYEDVTTWEWPLHPGWTRERISALRTPNIYRETLPLAGAQTGVCELLRQGHTLVVVSHDFPPFVAEKKRALDYWFPWLCGRVIFANKKHAVVPGAFLVDDCLLNVPHVLFAHPWNDYGRTLLSWQTAAVGWGDVVDYFSGLR